jgi:DNA mismatch endonuclease (patch repair protein)
MRANRGRDTGPERALRSALHASGLRFRVNTRIRAGDLWVRPDIVFTRQRVAVFVDGCFWHGCPQHASVPQANRAFWEQKLDRNQERDVEQTAALKSSDWAVVRLWEHQSVQEMVMLVRTELAGR